MREDKKRLTNSLQRACFGALAVLALAAAAAPALAQSRGELLYTIHCIACHDMQLHWRDARKATDWDSLRAEVQRWQGQAQLAWTDQDIDAVTRHLNDGIYRFKPPPIRQALAAPAR